MNIDSHSQSHNQLEGLIRVDRMKMIIKRGTGCRVRVVPDFMMRGWMVGIIHSPSMSKKNIFNFSEHIMLSILSTAK